MSYKSIYNYNSYYGLTNKCLPRTEAITDNSKFNVGTLLKIYINNEQDTRDLSNCNKLTNHSSPNDIKAFDKNPEICLNKETELEPQGCKTCSVENLI